MKIKLSKKREKYNCVIEEIDNKQIIDLEDKINNSTNLEPWLLTFVKRFSKLANKKNVSKKDISDTCRSAKLQKPQLKGIRDILPASTLSSITNPESDNIRLPNVNHLIVLSKYFRVSIDYLVGLSDSPDPKLAPLTDSLGLTNKTLRHLMLYKELLNIPQYSPFPESGLPMTADYDLDFDAFSSIDEDGFFSKYHYGKDSYSKNDIVKEINDIISKFPDIFSESVNASLAEKRKIFDCLKPNQDIYETLELLLTYKNGHLINLISKYLHLSEDINIIPDSTYDNFSKEGELFYQISSELIRLHDETKKAIT